MAQIQRLTRNSTLYASATMTQTTSGSAVSTSTSVQPITNQANNYNGPMTVFLDVTTATGTSPTLDLTIEGRVSSSGAWTTLAPASGWTQVTSTTGTQARTYLGPLPGELRAKFTIGGTTPTYVASVTAVQSTGA